MSESPRPWTVEPWRSFREDKTLAEILDAEGGSLLLGEVVPLKTAEEIVRAVNAFDALLAAAQKLLPPKAREPGQFYGDEFTMQAAYAAIEYLDEHLPGWREWTR